jgi:hypothetical protein
MRGRRIGTTSLSMTLRSACVAGGLTLSLVFAFASSAGAAGPPINIGTPFTEEQPSVAVDSAGDAVVAWANTKDLPPTTTNIVQYCVLPVGATGCSHSGNLIPADGATNIDNVQVLSDGSALVILADVYGAQGGAASSYEPEQEWQSTDGGATFTAVNAGKSVAEGILSADTKPLSAVIVPGTGVLGYGWDTAGESPPTFNAFPLTSPPDCSEAMNGCPAGFASLEPNTNPDQIGNPEGQFASQAGAAPGVLGVFFTNFTNGPLACSNAQTVPFGTAFAYGSGNQSSTNNYNISPGEPNSAWKVAVSQADCNVEFFAVAGGPSGFGILEDNELTGQTVYHRFDQSTDKFDTPLVTVAQEGEESPAVSQDGAGGVYATFLGDGGPGGPIRVAYSADGGNTWSAGTLNPDSDQRATHVTSSVNTAGQGWAAWTDNGSVYAQSFQASDAIAAAVSAPAPDTITTSQTAGTTVGANITVPAGTLGETDSARINGANATTASGTVSYGLYSNPTCTVSSKVLQSSTAVTAGNAAASAPVATALTPGTYFWQDSYSGNATNLPSVSSCGSEVLTITAPPKAGEGATSTSTTLTVTITCAGPCTVTLTITIPTASAARKSKKKPKPLTLATGTFTLPQGGTKKLTLHLTKIGRKVFAAHHGRLKASLLLSEKIDGHTILSTKTIKIVPAKHKHKK